MLQVPDAARQERNKYSEIWKFEEYKKFSPGLENVPRFMDVMKPENGASLLDVGCGAGVAGLEFKRLGLDVWWLDITDAGLDPVVNRDRFIEAPLWSAWPWDSGARGWSYGFCCDVMEHIPPEYVMLVIDRILEACETVWFHIALKPDQFGMMIGEPLHLTVRPYEWWLVRLATVARIMDARDLCGNGMFVVGR